MAGLLTHEWIAYLVLKKLSKRNFISKYANIDDYFFGAEAWKNTEKWEKI